MSIDLKAVFREFVESRGALFSPGGAWTSVILSLHLHWRL